MTAQTFILWCTLAALAGLPIGHLLGAMEDQIKLMVRQAFESYFGDAAWSMLAWDGRP